LLVHHRLNMGDSRFMPLLGSVLGIILILARQHRATLRAQRRPPPIQHDPDCRRFGILLRHAIQQHDSRARDQSHLPCRIRQRVAQPSQTHGNSVARNVGLRVTGTGSAPMTVREATLLRATSSSIRLAHLQDFREWITRPFRLRLRFIFTCSVRASQGTAN
jgi:hypothetical protein